MDICTDAPSGLFVPRQYESPLWLN